jgi:hypothetical protein
MVENRLHDAIGMGAVGVAGPYQRWNMRSNSDAKDTAPQLRIALLAD